MKKIRFFLAIIVGKTIFFLTRTLGRGGGTAAPGLIANKLYPPLASQVTNQLKYGSVVITGTNGKTTTSRILSSILCQAGYKPIHNRAGSNLMRGVTSTLIEKCTLGGKIKANIGIWEIDEATFPHAVKDLNPKIVIITNLFRDQLDRYGEIDTIKKIWEESLLKLSRETVVILCGDDPNVASLGLNLKNKVFYFGIEDKSFVTKTLPHSADCKQCPRCGSFLSFSSCFFSHLSSQYTCTNCGFSRPPIDLICRKILFKDTKSTQVSLNTLTKQLNLKIYLSGLYNVYNLLAAVATAQVLKVTENEIEEGVLKFRPAFGRIEKISAGKKEILLLLCKNPTGFNEVLRTITRKKKKLNILIAINDCVADGRDVSWLWDVDFEVLREKTQSLIVSGVRAEDMALRLKYAGLEIGNWYAQGISRSKQLEIEKSFQRAITLGLKRTKAKEALYILPTYTAMLEIRKVLNKMGLTHKSWED